MTLEIGDDMKIAVYGAGGVGAFYGGKLAQAGAEVALIARGAHLEAIRSNGLEVRSIAGDFRLDLMATDDPSEIGPCDLVLFCVKSYDTESAAAMLPPLMNTDTAVLSLQNGVDNEEKIEAVTGKGSVMGGVAYVFSTITSPGVVNHTGGPGTIAFGEMDGKESPRAKRFLEFAHSAGIASRIEPNIRRILWEKLIFICAQAGTTSAIRLPLGDIRTTPESYALFRALLEETAEVGRAEGVEIPDESIETIVQYIEALPEGAFSSLHHDMVHGNRMELEALHGTVLRLAAKHGLEVPATRVIYAILKPWADRNLEANAR